MKTRHLASTLASVVLGLGGLAAVPAIGAMLLSAYIALLWFGSRQPVLELDEAREHPHMKARGAYVEHDGIWHTAPAPRFSRTPGAVRSSADDGADVVARWAGQG